ncbi:MAG: hypothetical protein HRU22_08540 [Gammaproteobacteria bacterium]|nr:hypothetical protein [Gammaproteobacteria bacterium]
MLKHLCGVLGLATLISCQPVIEQSTAVSQSTIKANQQVKSQLDLTEIIPLLLYH